MKKTIIMAACCTILMSSCGTYTGAGAGTGAYFGGHIGSAIGGLTGGYRGHAAGTLIGMASGAAIGAAAGAQKDAAIAQREQNSYRGQRMRERSDRYTGYIKPSTSSFTESITEPVQELALIRNLQLSSEDGGSTMHRGGKAKITFELMNTSESALYDVMPDITLTNSDKNLFISPNITVECITPGEGIRYTAHIWSSKRVRQGTYTFNIVARQEGSIISQSKQVRLTVIK